MRSRLVRLDALGEQLTQLASLEDGEFDFSVAPGLGGPDTTLVTEVANSVDIQQQLSTMFARLDSSLDSRESQLILLQSMLSENKLKSERMVAGRPIKKGWMSSHFGLRTDPFTGRKAMHEGVDFAGKLGSEIIAVGSGVVTWSGERYGYGRLVEINHGNGFMTRYAHNMENKVEVGDIVKKGQTISLMGSSGRSTGPHVHFEVYKHGRPVDPATYIHRTNR